MRKNIDLTITQPLKLTASPPLAQLVDFSVLREVHKELGMPDVSNNSSIKEFFRCRKFFWLSYLVALALASNCQRKPRNPSSPL